MKRLREMLGYSQQEFASLLGLSISTISRWERGDGNPTFSPGQWKKLLAEMQRINLSIDALPDSLTPGNNLILG